MTPTRVARCKMVSIRLSERTRKLILGMAELGGQSQSEVITVAIERQWQHSEDLWAGTQKYQMILNSLKSE